MHGSRLKSGWVTNLRNVQVRAALADVAAQDRGPEASHRVIHIMTDGSYSVRQLVFASRWVAERFMAKAAVEDEQGLVSLVNGSTGTFRGLMHEAWMHRTLPKVRLASLSLYG